MNDILNKIEASFRAALSGKENISTLIYRWGIAGWVIAYFISNKLIKMINISAMDILISSVTSFYFVWHIYVLKKCSPKKLKLSKEEKRKLRKESRKDFGKKFMRKLLLQESITKWDPVFVTIAIDAFCIAHFCNYIF
jgi:hypothetical protein